MHCVSGTSLRMVVAAATELFKSTGAALKSTSSIVQEQIHCRESQAYRVLYLRLTRSLQTRLSSTESCPDYAVTNLARHTVY
jgi:hypothetical protein